VEEKRALTTEAAKVTPASYKAGEQTNSIRARRDEVLAWCRVRRKGHLVDVRSVDEFTGKILAPPGLSETAQRAAAHSGRGEYSLVQASNEDGTFKSRMPLAALYQGKGVTGGVDETIAYCRIVSAVHHTWFV